MHTGQSQERRQECQLVEGWDAVRVQAGWRYASTTWRDGSEMAESHEGGLTRKRSTFYVSGVATRGGGVTVRKGEREEIADTIREG